MSRKIGKAGGDSEEWYAEEWKMQVEREGVKGKRC